MEWKTRQVADIHEGFESSDPRFLKEYNGALYFQATNEVTGSELWVADYALQMTNGKESDDGKSSSSFPTLFYDLMPGQGSSNPSFLQVHSNFLYFSADGVDLSWMVFFIF